MAQVEAPAGKALEAHDIAKYYSGVPALAGVSIAVHPGEIVGLVGHNGAGKSTLLKFLAGAHSADEGYLSIDGEEVSFSSPADALAHGVATVYQELSLLQNLTVTENVWLGRELKKSGFLAKADMRKEAEAIMEAFDLDVDVDRKVGRYPVATRQLMEIAIASSKNIEYLLLDEPTTSLEGEQVENLLAYIKRLATEKNIGVLIVNHKLDELYKICDRIVALVDGRSIIDGRVDEISHKDVVAAIAGDAAAENLGDSTAEAEGRAGTYLNENVVLSVKDLRSEALDGVTLDVRAGEVLGIYGLIGAGRTEFIRTLAGIDSYDSGEITLEGKPFKPKNPKQAMAAGIVYVTEERKLDGIVPQLSGIQNAALPVLQRFQKAGWLNVRKVDQFMDDILTGLDIRGNIRNPVVSLSGGNQQKVLLARAIALGPKVLMLDEPTKGVDIGAKSEIHRIFKNMAHEEGIAVIVVSSEEEEILEVSDRICVFANGTNIAAPEPLGDATIASLRQAAWERAG